MEKAVDIDEITKKCVDEIVFHGQQRKKWLIFTAGIQHCEHVTQEILSRGISCEMVIGDTDKKERENIVKRFKSGETKCLVNVATMTTGVNVPDIDMIAFLRPTKSPVLYIQMIGRGLRTAEGKENLLCLDFGGVIENLGPIDSVEIRKKNTAKDPDAPKGDAILKHCPACGEMCAAAQRFCYVCSYSFINDALNTKSEDHNAILSSDEPIEERAVIAMNIDKHYKGGNIEATPSLCVSYITMSGVYKEWICFEHKGYARDKAIHWHKKMGMEGMNPPNTIDDAIGYGYKAPSKVMIRKEGKYYRVKDISFDKSDEPEAIIEPPKPKDIWNDWMDDEIPF